MYIKDKLNGLYVITDDILTPDETMYNQVEQALKGGATIVQLRDKKSSDDIVEQKAKNLQKLCCEYGAKFILNDKIDMAIKLKCDGVHIGKSDYDRFEYLRENFDGIIGVSCYADISLAKLFEALGANYVAFGSFHTSPTKPNSDVVPLDTLAQAKKQLNIPVCAIGGINSKNVDEVLSYKPNMISVISDIWSSEDIISKCMEYAKRF